MMNVRTMEMDRERGRAWRATGLLGTCAVVLALVGCSGDGIEASTEEGDRARGFEEGLDLDLTRARFEFERTTVVAVDSAPGRHVSTVTALTPTPGATQGAEGQRDIRSAKDRGVHQDALRREAQRIIARWTAEARTVSKGRVTPSEVTVAVHVRDLGTQRELLDLQGRAPLIPASNLKLLTVAAALTLLGPDAVFETVFEASATPVAGVLQGDLVVRAGGDPLYDESLRGGLDPWLESLAQQLGAAGIRRVSGRLVLDDSGWEQPGVPSGWPSARDHWQSYCALCAGFTANAGCLTATVTPTRASAAATVELLPAHTGLEHRVSVKTGARRSGNDVRVGATAKVATVGGTLAEGDPTFRADFAHPDPRALFAQAVLGGLARRGIAIDGGHVFEGAPTPGAIVARWRTPMASVWVPILRDSNNSVADQLFLALAYAHTGFGDRQHGAAAVREALVRLGVDPGPLVVVDGSGLSKDDRCTAEQLCALLAALAAGPKTCLDAVIGALPVAGKDSKLSSRMRGTDAAGRVRAKTGFVNGASSLSGYVDTLAGGRLAFSILVNYPRVSGLNTAVWKPMQDELCGLFVGVEAR